MKKAREVIAEVATRAWAIGVLLNEEDVMKALKKAGFVIVPKEPSEEMIEAGWGCFDDDNCPEPFAVGKCYRAMLSSAQGDGE